MAQIDDSFLLNSSLAKELFEVAQSMPIFDYHCHLDPQMIAQDHVFSDITELWLAGDHYKWRAMRAAGVEEKYITGTAENKEKFKAWAETLPYLVGNPLFHWSALELKNYFQITEPLSGANWEKIYEQANAMIQEQRFSAKSLILKSNVRFIGTTDSPLDSLEYHDQMRKDPHFPVEVAPTFRPDEAFQTGANFPSFLKELGTLTGITISDYASFLDSMKQRIAFFDEMGCKASDISLTVLAYDVPSPLELKSIFEKVTLGTALSKKEQICWETRLFLDLGAAYAQAGWVMQLHFGALRNQNSRLFHAAGPNAGADSMTDQADLAVSLNRLLNTLEEKNALPQTIVYNLNPAYNDLVACTLANFQGNNAHIKGKMQFGAGWWFCDTKRGMIRQMETVCDYGMLYHFVGMLTDSRSFLSYPRHEYFRRILCQLIAAKVESGEFPDDRPFLKEMVRAISYENAAHYFKKNV